MKKQNQRTQGTQNQSWRKRLIQKAENKNWRKRIRMISGRMQGTKNENLKRD
jgi:hypothetical protein